MSVSASTPAAQADPQAVSISEDFHDAIEWAAVQPWSTGKVGLNGISYYAMTQWLVAATQPPHLSCMIPWEGGSNLYREFARHGGIHSHDFVETWFPRQVLSVQHGNPKSVLDPWLNDGASGTTGLVARPYSTKNNSGRTVPTLS